MTKTLTLGQRIRYYRKKAGLSQSALAAAVGVSTNAISYYEKDKREPNIEMITRLAGVLNVASEVLLGLVRPDIEASYNVEHALLRAFRPLNDLGQNRVLEYALSLSETTKYTAAPDV